VSTQFSTRGAFVGGRAAMARRARYWMPPMLPIRVPRSM
jgi:hypothetical protein